MPLRLTDQGAGWAPAIIDHQAEFGNIDRAQRVVAPINRFWVGGSTNETTQDIDASSYIPTLSGK